MLCQVGDVVRLSYAQSHSEEKTAQRVVKVIGVRDTRVNPISRKAINANQIRRSRYLVTAKQSDGQIRAFYTDEVDGNAERVGLLGRTILYFQGVRFR